MPHRLDLSPTTTTEAEALAYGDDYDSACAASRVYRETDAEFIGYKQSEIDGHRAHADMLVRKRGVDPAVAYVRVDREQALLDAYAASVVVVQRRAA